LFVFFRVVAADSFTIDSTNAPTQRRTQFAKTKNNQANKKKKKGSLSLFTLFITCLSRVLLAFIKVAILVANNETSFHLQLLCTCCVLWSGFVVLLSHLLWLYSSCGNAMAMHNQSCAVEFEGTGDERRLDQCQREEEEEEKNPNLPTFFI
jgi:hypothetical protein